MLQRVLAFSLPYFVGSRHQQILERIVGAKVACMGHAETGQFLRPAKFEQEPSPGILVRMARLAEFLLMDCLADVVDGSAQMYNVFIQGEFRPSFTYLSRELAGDIVNKRK